MARALVPVVVLACALATPVSARQAGQTGPADAFTDRGLLVWRGQTAPLLSDIAAMVAPVLWFSPDEPLLLNGGRLPHAHPCDPGGGGVVYYQARRLQLAGPLRVTVPEHRDPGFFDKVENFTLRFYFYYDQDFGVGSHAHDLEVVEMHLALAREPSGDRAIRLKRVIGFAHGTDWYSNELHVEPDTRLPITVLVEEGKHASSPDRNADGIYTPGYDVNRRINDAWGVRDVLGSGFLAAGAYQASMTKPRRPADRRAPPTGALPPVSGVLASHDRGDAAIERYALRPAAEVPPCELTGPEPDRLRQMMRSHRFGPAYAADQYQFDLGDLAEPLTGTGSLIPSLGARWDRRIGVTVELRGADLRLMYVVPKINWVRKDLGVEALFTASAARVHSTYLSVGAAREYLERPEGEPSRGQWNPTAEVGMKFRTRLEGKQRIAALGYQFAGVRVGIRYSGYRTVRLTRMIIEFGPGVW